jgi:DUF4097 and DUF4098 domain-containing protein YvlB
MRLPLRAAAAIVPLIALTACMDMDFGPSDRYQKDFHYSYAIAPGGRLSLQNVNGSIDIYGWDKNSVEINGTKYAATQEQLDEIKIDVDASGNAVQIRTLPISNTGWGHHTAGARYTIRVPHSVVLDRITSSNGPIRVEDVSGAARLRTSNGAIRVFRVTGDLDLQTSNGGIEATGQNGNAVLHTSNGSITIEMAKGALDASTSNGSITARVTQADADQPVRLGSSNGHIELTLDAPRDVHATTSNSSIVVRMPDSVNARVRARTSNSSISSDFDVTVHGGTMSKHLLEGQLGSGGPLIDLSTSNGAIKLLRI